MPNFIKIGDSDFDMFPWKWTRFEPIMANFKK